MKKILLIVLFLFPFKIMAFSSNIIPGGETIGLDITNDGILIVGFYKTNGEYINPDLKIGDKITKIANEEVLNIDELTKKIEEKISDNKVPITYKRGDNEYEGILNLQHFNGNYRTGLYVKSSVVGIGTLTYIDPETGIYGTLGHIINESKTNQKVEVKEGFAYDAKVINFTKSSNGFPGSKNANILREKYFGSIENNTEYGVFGKISKKIDKQLMPISEAKEAEKGEASIYTTDLYNNVKEYKINIIEVSPNSKDKNYYFEIDDDSLTEMAGGIVQGMSGSPIIQNGKIIGAVTRVLVEDVSKGYGIDITTMLKEGDKILQQ